jgi:hypothetical protein
MCFGFECGDGWYSIIDNLCQQLVRLGGCEAVQVKEKFGGLRFYIDEGSAEQFEAIEQAERDSLKTCEVCGSMTDVALRGHAWVKTLCLQCFDKKE